MEILAAATNAIASGVGAQKIIDVGSGQVWHYFFPFSLQVKWFKHSKWVFSCFVDAMLPNILNQLCNYSAHLLQVFGGI